MNRRDFLTVVPWCAAAAATGIARAASRPRRILFLGGTGFFGPSAVQALIDAGHDVTLANRGVTNPGLFPELRLIRCDRDTPDGSGLAALRGALRREHFDWVVDTWQGHPAAVSKTARHTRDRAGAYQYVSTLAVYLDWDDPGINESYPLNDTSGLSMDWSAEHRYAIRKTLAEHEVRRYFPDSSCIFRSHGMRGYQIDEPRYEPYWPVRVQRGGDVLVPGDGRHYCQITDMVSLARFMVFAGETGVAGAYNVAYAPICFLDYLRSAERATGTRPRYHWIPAEVLAEYDVRPYRDIPLWRPVPAGSYRFDVSAAEHAGLRNRPLEALISDQLAGYRARNPDDGFRLADSGALSSELELRIVSEWQARSGRR